MDQPSPKEAFEKIANRYAKVVDEKPIHVYYERPNLLSLLPDTLAGLSVLDLGCGSGWYAEHLIKAGATVTALDASPTMVKLTQERLQNKATVHLADLEKPLPFPPEKLFDIIIAPLVIHYVQDWHLLFARLAAHLKTHGLLVFSTHQPQTESHIHKLNNYFEKTQIIDHWKDIGEVRFYHHTLHELSDALYQAGFMIERLLEPQPLPEMEKADPEMYRNLTALPWILFVKAVKS